MNQRAATLADGTVAYSSSVEAFEGARVALVLCDGVFRLDAVFVPDRLQFPVRNMTSGALSYELEGYPREVFVQGDADLPDLPFVPGHHEFSFRLGDEIEVSVLLATLQLVDTGLVRITTQALVRDG